MVARVIAAEVKEIIDTDKSDQVVDDSFIQTATLMVDDALLSSSFSDAKLKQIELYLAAHFLCIAEEKGGIILDKYGDATQEMQEIYSSGIKSTRYGQQALVLDTSGILAARGAGTLRAEFRVV